MNVDLPDRSASTCPQCGTPLEQIHPTHGHRYWTCPARHWPPVTILGPEVIGWSSALIRTRIVDGEFTDATQFDDDAVDPGRFVDRVYDRIAVLTASARDRERDRRSGESRNDSASDDGQAPLTGWSE